MNLQLTQFRILGILRLIQLVHMGNESYFKDYTLFKLVLAVVHISVNYQKIHKLNCMKQRMPRKAMLKRL